MGKAAKKLRTEKAAAPVAPPKPRLERLKWLGVCTLSGVMLFLATADFDIWPLAWVAMVPALFAIERASTRKRAVLFGWWTGLVANAGGFYWITTLLQRFGKLPLSLAILGFLVMCAYQAVVFALFAWFTRRIREKTQLPMALVAPVVMVTFELTIWMMLPWYLAITQAWQTAVIQIADLTGPIGVTALLLMVNGAIYDVATMGRKRLVPALVSAAVLAGALVYGVVRIGQMDAVRASAPKIKVGLVQGNVGFSDKGYENPHLARKQLADLQRLSAELEADGADLVVWTESSFPYWIPRGAPSDDQLKTPVRSLREPGGVLTPQFHVPLVLGAITYESKGDKSPWNSAIMQEPDGRFTATFDKMYLMLFSETIPLVEELPFLRKILPRAAGNFTRGKLITTFDLTTRDGRKYRLGPMVCLEDIVTQFARKLAPLHPHLLVNITNDAWFGDTSEPWEHMALSVFRSVEQRTEMVRAVNTGVSALIDLNGRVAAKTYAVDPLITPRPADKLLVEAAMVEGGHTFYARFGDVFGWLCVAATAFFWLLLPRLRRKRV
jgi:apolipoprotein N-acyltransferase